MIVKTLSYLEHLIRLYWSPEKFETNPGALEWLLNNQLIAQSGASLVEGHWWEVTERGKVYVEALRNVPLPEKFTEWRIP